MSHLPMTNAEVNIQTRTESRDAAGSIVTTWPTTYYKVKAYIQPNSIDETKTGGERQRMTGIARLPGYITVPSQGRIIWDSHTLQVNAAVPARRVPEIVDFYRVEWEEVTNAGL